MRRNRSIRVVSGLLLLLLAGCPSGDEPKSGNGQAKVEKGIAKGRVTYSNGKPLPGANITLTSTEYAAGIDGKSGSDGTYEINIGNKESNYRIHAWFEANYNDQVFLFPLEPQTNETTFYGANGISMNFIWKVSGRGWWSTDEADPRSYVGMSVEVSGYDRDSDPGATKPLNASPGSKVELTFTPAGKMIDGSEGQTINKTIDLPKGVERYSGRVGRLSDIPVGNYRVTAKLIDGGSTRDLKVAYTCNRSAPICSTKTSGFAPAADVKIASDRSVVHSRPYQGPPVAEVALFLWE